MDLKLRPNDQILVLTGLSGTGKSSLEKELVENGSASKIISHTSRPERKGEKEGEDYYFVTKEQFEKMKKSGEFFESVEYNGKHYGGHNNELKKVLATGRPVVMVTDEIGAQEIKKNLGANAKIILIKSTPTKRYSRNDLIDLSNPNEFPAEDFKLTEADTNLTNASIKNRQGITEEEVQERVDYDRETRLPQIEDLLNEGLFDFVVHNIYSDNPNEARRNFNQALDHLEQIIKLPI